MSTQIIEPLVTVEQLESMPDDGNKYEVIEGEIFVSRAPATIHQFVFHNFDRILGNYIVEHPTGYILPTVGVMFNVFSGVIPDLIYISRERYEQLESDGKIYGAPEIAIEIVSPGKENEIRDRVAKLQLYSRNGVSEYWVADSFRRTIELYRRTDARLQLDATLMETDDLTTPILPDFRCSVAEIFKR